MPWVYSCPDSNLVNVGIDHEMPVYECTGGKWIQIDSGAQFLPPLSIEDGAAIAMAIALCWVVGFAWREVRRAFSR